MFYIFHTKASEVVYMGCIVFLYLVTGNVNQPIDVREIFHLATVLYTTPCVTPKKTKRKKQPEIFSRGLCTIMLDGLSRRARTTRSLCWLTHCSTNPKWRQSARWRIQRTKSMEPEDGHVLVQCLCRVRAVHVEVLIGRVAQKTNGKKSK